jgi:hypothetical protein
MILDIPRLRGLNISVVPDFIEAVGKYIGAKERINQLYATCKRGEFGFESEEASLEKAENDAWEEMYVAHCAVQDMAVCGWLIERDELAIVMGLHLLPWWYSTEEIPHHLAEHEGVAEAMDELHLRKIDLAQEVFILNKDDYIGPSTKAEIEYAQAKGVPIRWYTHDPVGEKCRQIYADFILNNGEIERTKLEREIVEWAIQAALLDEEDENGEDCLFYAECIKKILDNAEKLAALRKGEE